MNARADAASLMLGTGICSASRARASASTSLSAIHVLSTCWNGATCTQQHKSNNSRYDATMQVLSANQAKTQFGQMIDMAQKAPVQVTRRNRVVGVMVSAQDYEDMRNFYANRLMHTLHSMAVAAQAKGLTPRQLDKLLSDES